MKGSSLASPRKKLAEMIGGFLYLLPNTRGQDGGASSIRIRNWLKPVQTETAD
jgi:hypothetical protein